MKLPKQVDPGRLNQRQDVRLGRQPAYQAVGGVTPQADIRCESHYKRCTPCVNGEMTCRLGRHVFTCPC